jgi:hypothetical protein
MIRHLWILILLLPMLASAQDSEDSPPQKAPVDVSAPLHRQIDASISRGVKYLSKRQDKDGSWGEGGNDYKVGTTALVSLALLNCGESHQSPALANAIKFLKKTKVEGIHQTYAYSLRAAFYSQLPEPVRKTELPADMRWLISVAIQKGDRKGLYSYGPAGEPTGWPDLSNSQYGVLGVWYAALAGLEVPTGYWRNVEESWQAAQNRDGGWGYGVGDHGSYGSMTAAGAATLFITNDYLHANQQRDLQKPYINTDLDRAITWLGRNYQVEYNPGRDSEVVDEDDEKKKTDEDDAIGALEGLMGQLGGRRNRMNWFVHYMLFAYERVGEASGLTRFGQTKWFDRGARFLIRTQNYDGSWDGSSAGPQCDTAWSLLFLSRGRAPVAIQKLQFKGRWNNRSRDAAQLVRWLSYQSERHCNWQILSSEASLAEFRESPLLYIASDRPLALRKDERDRIKTFIDQGGTLLAVNEGAQSAFADSIIQLGKEFYPQYEIRNLPDDHPINQQNFPMKGIGANIRGVSNGVRELIILIPTGDMSWKWQSGPGTRDPGKAPQFSFFGNLVLYRTEKANARFKGDDWWIEPDPRVKDVQTVDIARLRYDGNWDPEPLGWQRLSNVMINRDAVAVRTKEVAIEQLTPKSPLAHLTTAGALTLSPAQLSALQAYVKGGGVLLIDAAGGGVEAGIAIDTLVAQLAPDAKNQPLPVDHPIYLADANEEIRKVEYRRFGQERLRGAAIPRLRYVALAGGGMILYSGEDLSAALVGYSCDGIFGYTPDSATKLVRNIVRWRYRLTN